MLCCLCHHFFTHGHTAGKEDIIKSLIQQCLIFHSASFYRQYIFFRETFSEDFADDSRGCRGIRRRLYHTAVPCRNRADQGFYGQHKRIIPGRHDEYHSIRLSNGKAVTGKLCNRAQHISFSCPAIYML